MGSRSWVKDRKLSGPPLSNQENGGAVMDLGESRTPSGSEEQGAPVGTGQSQARGGSLLGLVGRRTAPPHRGIPDPDATDVFRGPNRAGMRLPRPSISCLAAALGRGLGDLHRGRGAPRKGPAVARAAGGSGERGWAEKTDRSQDSRPGRAAEGDTCARPHLRRQGTRGPPLPPAGRLW